MSGKSLIDMFSQYGLLSSEEEREEALDLYDDGEDDDFNALEILSEIASDRQIWFSLGDCADENVIEEIIGNFSELARIANGRLTISNLKTNPDVGAPLTNDQELSITLQLDNDQHHFSFSKIDPDTFISEFSTWAYQILEGDFLLINEDHPFGYHIPKALIKELEAIGLKNWVFT